MKNATALFWCAATSILAQQPFHPNIPKTWDAAALATLEVPNPDPRYSPVAVPVAYIGDLMRYAALNNEMDFLSRFGDFIPSGQNYRTLPDPSTQMRYSDEQLYALSLYLYSLKPPPNPNRPSALTRRGEKIFNGSCAGCHTPPLYSKNKLLPAPGVWYRGPFEHDGSVATLEDWFDPTGSALTTCPPASKGTT